MSSLSRASESGLPAATSGRSLRSLPSYEFHWTIGDFMTAVRDAGCELIALREIGDQKEGWETPPLTGLPQDLLIVERKIHR